MADDHEDYETGAAPAPHKTTHQDGGSDELSISGLAGIPSALAAHALLPTVHQDAPALILIHKADSSAHHDSTHPDYLKKNGSRPLTADWDLGIFKLTGLVNPTTDQGAATKKYVDDTPHGSDGSDHDIADHDTTATGTQLTTLTDNSISDALHRHSELVASDGSPDPALTVHADGIISLPHQSSTFMYLSTNPQTLPDATYTKVQLNAELYDVRSEGNILTHLWTAIRSGTYSIFGQVYITSPADGSISGSLIYKNGFAIAKSYLSQGASGDAIQTSIIITQLDANDYIQLYAFIDSNADEQIWKNANNTFLSIAKIH